MTRPALALALGALLVLTAPAQAQPSVTDPELSAVQASFDVGRYDHTLERARARIDRGALSEEALVLLHKFAGLSALNLSLRADAERHFTALLRVSPDHVLDPFAVPPAQIAFFDEVKGRLEPQLAVIREEQRLLRERALREQQEQLRRQAETEERRRRMEEQSRRVTVRTVEKRSFLVNLVPFGAGQFHQGRTTHGVALATTQGLSAAVSVVAYLAYEGLLKEERITLDTIDGPRTITRKVVPRERQADADTWRTVKYVSAGAFYTLYGYGVVDAVYHHQPETVTTQLHQLQPDPERGPQPIRSPDRPAPAPTGFLFPTSGGLGAGFSLRF
jgi:hypothetical protein